MHGNARPAGQVNLRVVRNTDTIRPGRELTHLEMMDHSLPKQELSDEVNDWRRRNRAKVSKEISKFSMGRFFARKFGLPYIGSQLWLCHIKANGEKLDLGLAGIRMVTTVGVNFLVDAFQNIVEPEIMNFHGIGTGGGAEAVGNTALTTELTTQYVADNTRATGAQGEGASANIYQTVGLNEVDAAVGITEHGIFSVAASGSGVLLDRTLFAVVNLGTGDKLESTYEFTISAGG